MSKSKAYKIIQECKNDRNKISQKIHLLFSSGININKRDKDDIQYIKCIFQN